MSDGTVTAPDGSGRQVKLITAEDVVAYLKAHPDFFEKNPELAAELASRVQGPGVIDMQQAILRATAPSPRPTGRGDRSG